MKAFLRIRLIQLKGRYPYLLFALSVLLLIIVFSLVYYSKRVEPFTEGDLVESLAFYERQLAGGLADPKSPSDIMTAGNTGSFWILRALSGCIGIRRIWFMARFILRLATSSLSSLCRY